MNQLHIRQSGKVFIVERNGRMVASSTDELPVQPDSGNQSQQLSTVESSNPLVRATAAHVRERSGNLKRITAPTQYNFELKGERQLVQVIPL